MLYDCEVVVMVRTWHFPMWNCICHFVFHSASLSSSVRSVAVSLSFRMFVLYTIVCHSMLLFFCLDHIENQQIVEYVIQVK